MSMHGGGGDGRGRGRGRGDGGRGRGDGGGYRGGSDGGYRGGGGGYRGSSDGGSRGGGSYRGGSDRGGSDRGGGFRGDRGGGGGYRGDRGGFRGDRGGGGGRGGRPGGGPTEFFVNKDQTLGDRDIFLNNSGALSDALSLTPYRAGAPKMSDEDTAHPTRPGFGTRGQLVKLYTNHLLMAIKDDITLYRYEIAFPAELLPKGTQEPSGKKRKRAVALLLQDHFAADRADLASDYVAMMISKRNLELDSNGQVYTVVYRAEDEDAPSPEDAAADAAIAKRTYKIRLTLKQDHSLGDLMSMLSGTGAGAMLQDRRLEIIQSLNVIVGSGLKENSAIASIGANKHYSLNAGGEDVWDLGAGLMAIRGYFISVRAAASRLLLNVQVKTGAFFRPGPLVNLMQDYLSRNRNDMNGLSIFLRRVSIIVTHREPKKNKAGRALRPPPKSISSLASGQDGRKLAHPPQVRAFGASAANARFWIDSRNAYVTVLEHFETEYPRLKGKLNSGLPIINTGSLMQPSYYPPEVCEVIAGQPARAALGPEQTSMMIAQALRKPAANAKSITTAGIATLGLAQGSRGLLNNFGIAVDPNLVTVQARVLPAPQVRYAGGKSVQLKMAGWNMAALKYNKMAQYNAKWSAMAFSYGGAGIKTPKDLQNIVETGAIDFFGKHGLKYQPANGPAVLTGPNADHDTPIATWVKEQVARDVKVFLVILPRNSPNPVYNAVKRVCDIQYGIHTVCVQEQKVQKFVGAQGSGPLQYWANVDLKLNLKLGGTNQLLDPADLGIISEGKTMVVGLDVTHPQPGSSVSAPSVAALVSSVGPDLAQWPAHIRVQAARQEEVENLGDLLLPGLRRWQKANSGALPVNILVCRDGVSEGQYSMVRDVELVAMKEACKTVYSAKQTQEGLPHFTVLVVGKRHHTRFYPAAERTNGDDKVVPRGGVDDTGIKHDGKGNTLPGTVVDRGVTEFLSWDFYLQAHAALIGTARPAHYYVIYDDIFRRNGVRPNQGQKQHANVADSLESLMYSMCYLYGRATKAVSICPPAYYADIACERARCYLSGLFEPTALSPSITKLPSNLTPSAAAEAAAEAAAAHALKMNNALSNMGKSTTVHANLSETMFYI